MTGKSSRPPSAALLVLVSFTLTAAALAGPHWMRNHVAARATALAASATH